MAIVKMILTNAFDPDIRVYKEAQDMISKGHEVEILCWDRESKYKEKPVEFIDGIIITRFFIPAIYGTGLKQISAFFKFRKTIIKYLKNKNFDILHCHDLDGAMIGKKIKNKAIFVFDMHEYYLNKSSFLYNFALKHQVRTCQNKARYIIYLNDKQKQDIAHKNLNKLIFLPNYPESFKFADCAKTESEKFRIGYAGYIRHKKPFKNLFLATQDNKELIINIYGVSSLGAELDKQYANRDSIKMHGKYNHDKIATIYKNIDLLFCVYVAENENDKNAIPTKFYESIISGTPILVVDNTAMADFVKKHGNGYIVNDSDAHNIKKIIDKIIADKTLYKQTLQNIETIQNNFKWEAVITNLDRIFSEIE